MMYRKEPVIKSSNGGVGFVGLLTITFIVLKLTGHIDWSWWWVLSPVWASILLVFVVIIMFLFVFPALSVFIKYISRKSKNINMKIGNFIDSIIKRTIK